MATRRSTAESPFGYRVVGTLEEWLVGGALSYWVVFLPAKMQSQAPFAAKKKVRIRGRVGGPSGKPVTLAWQVKQGRHYLLFGRSTAKALGITLGDSVTVEFDVVDDAIVDVPPELREALRQEPEWRKRWAALTPGKQRGIAHLVAKVKSPELRAQRAVDILRGLEDGIVPGPPRRRSS